MNFSVNLYVKQSVFDLYRPNKLTINGNEK